MTYNLELSVSANISSKVVEDIIRSVVEEQTGKKIASIEPKLIQEQRGMAAGSTQSTVFDGYQIYFVAEKLAPPKSKVGPQFVEDRYE